MRVALFIPCYVDQLAPEVGVATLELLEALGAEVAFPLAQACCGQPLANLGCVDDARPLALGLARAFADGDAEWVVAPSGSCIAMVRRHAPALARDARERALLESLASRARELCEFLVDVVGVERVRGRYARRVALHQGCHGLRELRLGNASERMDAPAPVDRARALLERLDGIALTPQERADECCGFGGTFAVAEDAVSARMGSDRIDDLARGGPDVVASTDVSCLLHLRGLASRRAELSGAPPLAFAHVAELLRDAVVGRGEAHT